MKDTSIVLILAYLLLRTVMAAHRGEGCFGNPNCPDTGLTCTGSRCYCLMDLSPDFARFWACNADQDCPIVAPSPDRSANASKPLQCIPSVECPAVAGFSGYCNIEKSP